MASIDIRVELPAYSQSFHIQVSSQWSIKDVKSEIQRACTGSPSIDGQRLIWRGRFLRDDESVKDVWKSADDARIVHLSVNPSAWSSSPPTLPATSPTSPTASLSLPPQPQIPRRDSVASSRSQPQVAPAPMPLASILSKHNAAIHVLTHGNLPASEPAQADPASRAYAVSVLQMYGFSWPAIFDDEYPPASSGAAPGVKYEQVILDNQPYLNLVTPNVTPSPMQLHALKVLSCTFPLLSISPPEPMFYPPIPQYNTQQQMPTINLNQYLQQLGFPGLRVPGQPNANQNPADPNMVGIEVRAIPFRALMMPLMMLLFRTFLLVYFFSPSQRPVFGLILSAWIFYEAWGALRGIIGGDRQNNNNAGGQVRGADGAAGADAPQRGQGQGAGATNNNPSPANRPFSDRIVDVLAHRGLQVEEACLNNSMRARKPNFLVKAVAFTHLFFATLHPAVWDRRRTELKRREGRLRTEAGIRESPEVDDITEPSRARSRRQAIERQQRRQPWVQRYVERVLETEYVDDA